ncbi:complex I subunit 4 family protein [Photobacterium angustum]|uniref:NADH-quinone oxidoreductase subunit M n=1 Tax=Photobacterium angustum TaxID=661 RepID=A0A855SBZ2_PHOAN|nr:NADH-quinone oxidoreductase subunit M [Photobacterium angustum]KJF81006.1 oxidoreductase [Photobacterium damselae subsp. damselae]KJG41609.1 oxidoreductase [Photobacterium angustum]KJG44486.1 oxidoreductase [Photobacterium angustum]KJG49537.1 oxidoreductase [Photobacterium angustum]PSX06985.1 NADH-quinone oxidoreductase subunit M [Photobacterium angustum]
MLSLLIFLPMVAALLIGSSCRKLPFIARSMTLTTLIIESMLVAWIFITHQVHGFSMTESLNWIPDFGIKYLVSMDGISLSLIGLTCTLFIVAMLVAWHQVNRWQAFGPLMLLTLSGIMGAFLALDLMLFYVFWELMLIPIYFMLSFWGGKGTKQAALKFVLVTITGSLLMLVSLVALYIINGNNTGVWTFDYFYLASHPITGELAIPVVCGFLIAFLIKIPGFPFHFWAPDTYREGAPAVSLLLSGVMANVGAYGILRFCLAIFPEAMHQMMYIGMALGAIGSLYAALLAFRQKDLRNVIAYSSISHMNLVVLAIFAWQLQALNGAVIQLIAHGLSVAGLFAVVRMLQARGFSGKFDEMGGLYKVLPGIGVFLLFIVAASVGIPGLGNFAGEILLLAGSFSVSPLWTSLAAFSIVLGVVYFLRAYGLAFLGPISDDNEQRKLIDLTAREKLTASIIVIGLFWVGLEPNYLLQLMMSSTKTLASIHSGSFSLIEGVINVIS